MIMIDLTLKSGTVRTFIINGNVTFGDNYYQDSNHNNSGWEVQETREEIKKKINIELKKLKKDI